jgi:hypothetical protein
MIANIIRNAKKYSATGDPYYSAVSLMLSMDGTNGSTTFTDSSLNALTVTPVGNTQISTTQSKYGASGYFDGTGDYLSIAANAAINLSSSDFTIEFWIRPAPKTNAVDAAFGYGNYSCMFYHNGTNWTLEMSSTGFSNQLVISFAVTLNTWQHIAIVRYGTSIVVYKDGVSSATGTFSGTVATSGRNLRIGDNGNSQNINGYIDDFRISQFARYVSTFTPPTAALPTTASSTVADPYYNYTSLLLHMDGTNASTSFVDSGPNALAVTVNGDAKISTSQSKFGGASAYFDGTGDYLIAPSGTQFNYGTGDFTWEFWFNATSLPSTNYMLDHSTSGNGGTIHYYNGILRYYNTTVGTGSVLYTAGFGSAVAGSWYHLAASRSNGTTRLFKDGVLITSASDAHNYPANRVVIGASGAITVPFNGYIDDFRISKYARYTSAFTPPTTAFPNA